MTAFLQGNQHLWDEEEQFSGETSVALSNVAAEKYVSAERMLSAAILLDHRSPPKDIAVGETLDVSAVGYLYGAAAVQFFVALEALVNLLYRLLLRSEFQSNLYERFLRADIDLRLAAIHVFCSGFSMQPVDPAADLWQRVRELRDFRNDFVHGNVTKEHEVRVFSEDDYLFFYHPAIDFRGTRAEAKRQRRIPRTQSQIRHETVDYVKQTVDQVREALLSAMDEDTASWVRSWILSPVVRLRG
jgi:hypothetical protein